MHSFVSIGIEPGALVSLGELDHALCPEGVQVRFLEKGTDIPDGLIRAVNDGSATFLCGAGVSFRAGLPSFKLLTEEVYSRLGESWDDEPAERLAIESEQFDRALRSLEKRTHLPRTSSRLRDKGPEL